MGNGELQLGNNEGMNDLETDEDLLKRFKEEVLAAVEHHFKLQISQTKINSGKNLKKKN